MASNSDQPDISLEALIQKAQQGDKQAFAQVVEQHYDLMFRYAMKLTADPEDAADVAHEACLKLARSINQFRFESQFSTWLYRLVVNSGRDWIKAQKRHLATGDLAEEPSRSAEAESMIRLQQVLNTVDSLGAGMLETVLLVMGEGLSHQEAATILEIGESTVSWRIHQVRKQLRDREDIDE